MSGRFITFEGTEGAGKSTCLAFVQAWLEARGVPVERTREPGGTPLGEEIRGLLLGHRDGGMEPLSELLLLFAARAQHVARRIRPALAAGRWVLCDRFTDASYAYQAAGRGLDPEIVSTLALWVQGGLEPDLTLWLDLPVEQGLARAGRRAALDRFEAEDLDFHRRVRRAYRRLAEATPGRIRRLDASLPIAQVETQARAVLEDLYGRA